MFVNAVNYVGPETLGLSVQKPDKQLEFIVFKSALSRGHWLALKKLKWARDRALVLVHNFIDASQQGDQMSLWKSRPKCSPTRFCQN
jgi:hypothetical protein